MIIETLVLPQFLVCSDLRRSISLVYWSTEQPLRLSIQADSFRTHTAYATAFYDSSAENLRIITSDDEKNICLLSYSGTSKNFQIVLTNSST